MPTCTDYIDKIKTINNIESDYAVAKLLGVSRQRMSNYRNKIRFFDDLTAMKVAELLQINALEVIANVNKERATTAKEKDAWQFYITRLVGSMGIIFLSAPIAYEAMNLTFSQSNDFTPYLLCEKNRRRTRRIQKTCSDRRKTLGRASIIRTFSHSRTRYACAKKDGTMGSF